MASSIEAKESIKQYAKAVDEQFLTGIATEHSYRPAPAKWLQTG